MTTMISQLREPTSRELATQLKVAARMQLEQLETAVQPILPRGQPAYYGGVLFARDPVRGSLTEIPDIAELSGRFMSRLEDQRADPILYLRFLNALMFFEPLPTLVLDVFRGFVSQMAPSNNDYLKDEIRLRRLIEILTEPEFQVAVMQFDGVQMGVSHVLLNRFNLSSQILYASKEGHEGEHSIRLRAIIRVMACDQYKQLLQVLTSQGDEFAAMAMPYLVSAAMSGTAEVVSGINADFQDAVKASRIYDDPNFMLEFLKTKVAQDGALGFNLARTLERELRQSEVMRRVSHILDVAMILRPIFDKHGYKFPEAMVQEHVERIVTPMMLLQEQLRRDKNGGKYAQH